MLIHVAYKMATVLTLSRSRRHEEGATLQSPLVDGAVVSREDDEKELCGCGMTIIPRPGSEAMAGCAVVLPVRVVAADQPKVKQKSSTPGARNSISKVRSEIGPDCRISW